MVKYIILVLNQKQLESDSLLYLSEEQNVKELLGVKKQ